MDEQNTKLNELQEMMRLLANAVSNMRGEMLSLFEKAGKKIDSVEKRLGDRIDKVDLKIDKVEERLNQRIDKIGLQIANLEDDAPTREEFDQLSNRVKKVENVVLSA